MIKKVSNYTFKNLQLLNMALTHRSYSKENYERLEFLGDSILDFVVGEYLYKNSQQEEGSLTKYRASFVSEKYLSKVFDKLELESYVKLGKSYKTALSPSIKADIVEALIAAVYLDAGITKAKKFVTSIINIGNFKTMKDKDYKTQIQEFTQANKQKIAYKTLSKQGKSHNPTFEVGLFIDGKLLEKASGPSKHKAEQEAAKKAVLKLKNNA